MYAVLMEELIDTKVDLAILEKAKVIENNVGTDQSLVGMWKNMCIDKCYDQKLSTQSTLFNSIVCFLPIIYVFVVLEQIGLWNIVEDYVIMGIVFMMNV